jgi:hypothetical protein
VLPRPTIGREMTDKTPNHRGGALLPAAKLWCRTSARGADYLAGRLGGVKVLVMPKREGEDGDHTQVLCFAEGSDRRDAGR